MNISYNAANQISQIAELTQTKNFSYDNVDRLTAMNNGTANENYAFDVVGNRTSSNRSTTYNYQPFNRVTSTQTANYVYDTNGNMVSKSEGSNFWRYGWDYENRLVTASTRKQTIRYRYDALGRRVQRYFVGGRENTKFIYDGLDVVMDDNGGVLTKYQNGLGIDNKLKMITSGQAKYFLQDHLGSTVGLADSGGNVVSSASYDSFGNSTNNLTTRYQYTGREYDSFTGLQFYRARWYDANLGRFISEDPIGFAGGDVNLFGYVKNSPIRYSDFSGLIGDDAVRNLAPEQFGGGWRGRVDGGIGTTEGFEIHVYSPSISSIGKEAEVGIVSGRLGWIGKHGNPGIRPFGIPDDVMNKLNGLNALESRRYGLIPQKGVACGINPEGETVSGNIRGGSYLFPNRTLFNVTGGAIGVLGFIDGLFIDYDTYSRSTEGNRSFGEQFKQDNRNYPYLITPLGILKNPSYFPEA